jgi:hypothetical protein
MNLESVWTVLENGSWESKQALGEASGLDEDELTRIIAFLDRWNFVDVQTSPEQLVRRRPGAVSPVETFQVLRAISAEPVPSTRHRLAERVACYACAGRDLSFVRRNMVECVRCHKKQWYAIEIDETLTNHESEQLPERLGFLGRMLLRLGLPQPAFSRNIPKPVQYFWFRCVKCGRVSADYPHGHVKYLNCPSCECHNHF